MPSNHTQLDDDKALRELALREAEIDSLSKSCGGLRHA